MASERTNFYSVLVLLFVYVDATQLAMQYVCMSVYAQLQSPLLPLFYFVENATVQRNLRSIQCMQQFLSNTVLMVQYYSISIVSPLHNVDSCIAFAVWILPHTYRYSAILLKNHLSFVCFIFPLCLITWLLHICACHRRIVSGGGDSSDGDGDKKIFITSLLYVLWWQCWNAGMLKYTVAFYRRVSLFVCMYVYVHYTVSHFQMINRLADHEKNDT